MKKIVLFILFFTVYNLSAVEFDLMPVNIHYLGSVATSKNIIAYGTNGSYMITNDKAKTWERKSVLPYGNIQKMVNYNDTLWGVIDAGFIIKSTDHGENWIKYKIDIDNEDAFINLVVNDNYLFIRSISSISKYDKQCNFINIFTDNIIKVNVSKNNFDSPTSYFYNNLYLVNNNTLIINTIFYSDGFISLSSDLETIKYWDMTKNIFIDTLNPSIIFNKILKYKNGNIFQINSNLFVYNLELDRWYYFFPDSMYFIKNQFTSLDYPLGYTFSYFTYNDNLFMKYKIQDTTRKNIGDSQIYTNYGILKYDNNTNIFSLYNNIFDNKYYSSQFNSDENYTSVLSYVYSSDNTILEDTIIVMANKYNTILQSQDNCNTWELKSYLRGSPKIILNDSNYVFLGDSVQKDICISNNYGSTFMPTEIGLDTLTLFINKKINDSTIITNKYFDTVSYFSQYKYNRLFYLDETGYGLWSGPINTNTLNNQNIAYTKDGGRHYKFMLLDTFKIGAEDNTILPITKIDDYFLFTTSYPYWYSIDDSIICYIYFIDTSFTKIKKIPYNSNIDISYFLAIDLEHFFMFTNNRFDKDNYYNKRFEIKETHDSGKTSNTILYFNEELYFTQFYEHNKDSLFIVTNNPSMLYLYDRQRNMIDTLYNGENDSLVNLMVISDKFYLVGSELFLENTDRNDLRKWQKAKWDYGTPNFESVIFKGNVAIAKLNDSLRPSNYYRITIKDPTDIKDNEIIDRSIKNYFYASPAYPNPSKNIVKSRITWDMSFDLVSSISGVYNIFGEKVEGRNNISINETGKCQADLFWNSSGLPNGVYFIIINHNGKSDCIPVVIQK